jgi:uncharacterized membrane protein
MKVQKVADATCLALIAGMLLFGILSRPTAPERFPMHWNLHGEIDRYGGRFEGLFALPLMALGVYLLLRFLPRLDPGRANYANFVPAWATLQVAVIVLLAGVYGIVQASARGTAIEVRTVMPLAIGALFVVLGNVLGKLRPNWFFGIRTPWTLSSAESWNRTHRLGGWVFILLGLLTMGTALVAPGRSIRIMAGLILFATLGLAAYSYVVWRRDPDKVPPAGRIAAS